MILQRACLQFEVLSYLAEETRCSHLCREKAATLAGTRNVQFNPDIQSGLKELLQAHYRPASPSIDRSMLCLKRSQRVSRTVKEVRFMKSPVLFAAGVAVAAIATASLVMCSPAQAAEPYSGNASGKPLVTYTVKQFSADGKSLGEWTTRFERPSGTDRCVRWRTKLNGPINEVCGGIIQVTADEQPVAVIQ